jgi:hypothetical protein
MSSLETRRGRMLARGDREPSARKLSVIPPWEKKAKKEKNASRQKKKGNWFKQPAENLDVLTANKIQLVVVSACCKKVL